MTTIYLQTRTSVPAPALVRFHRPPAIAITPNIADMLSQHVPVAIGVSGGKDSQAAAMATFEHLDRIGHAGPRLLIHADLGVVDRSFQVRRTEADRSRFLSASNGLRQPDNALDAR